MNLVLLHFKESPTSAQKSKTPFEHKLSTSINTTWSQVRYLVLQEICKYYNWTDVTFDSVKFLLKGRFLKEEHNSSTLSQLQIQNESKILLVINHSLMEQPKQEKSEEMEHTALKRHQIEKEEQQIKRIQKIKQAAQEMANRRDGGTSRHEKYHFELEDQNGNKIDLPSEDRRSLIYAMTIQEKAKELMRERAYKDALELLRDADESFRTLPPNLLTAVDNYGYIQLDIVWCMFQLRDSSLLIEADQRLQVCEQMFKRVHGENMENILLIKSGAAPEMVLYARLHLLQGIVSYHLQRIDSAKQLLSRAHQEISSLQIEDDLIANVVSMGFTRREAVVALRACQKSIDRAVMFILDQREQKKQKRQKEKERSQTRKQQVTLGVCRDGKFIDLNTLQKLVFDLPKEDKDMIAAALRLANNNESSALKLLVENRRNVQLEMERFISAKRQPPIQLLSQITSLGFEARLATFALQKFDYNINEAINAILNGTINFIESTPQPQSSSSQLLSYSPQQPKPISVPVQQTRTENTQIQEEADDEVMEESSGEEEDIDKVIDEEIIAAVDKDQNSNFEVDLSEEMQALQTYQQFVNK